MKIIPVFASSCLVCALAIEAATFRAPIHAVGRNATASNARRLKSLNYDPESSTTNSTQNVSNEQSEKQRMRSPGTKQKPLSSDLEDVVKGDGTYWSCWSDGWTASLKYSTDDGLELLVSFHSPKLHETSTNTAQDWKELSYITTLSIGTPPQPFNTLLSISSSDLFVPSALCLSGCNEHRQYNASASSTHKKHSDYVTGPFIQGDMYGTCILDASTSRLQNLISNEIMGVFISTVLLSTK